MSRFYHSERQNFTWTKSIFCSEWQGFRGTCHSCWLKTSLSKRLCFLSVTQAIETRTIHDTPSTALTTTPFEL